MQATGYSCDYCDHFEKSNREGHLPPGWITLQPKPRNGDPTGVLHLCSNRCTADIAIERHEVETGQRFNRRRRDGVSE